MTVKNCRCFHCKTSTKAALHRQIFHNGTSAFVWICESCQRKNPENKNLYIEKSVVEEYLDDAAIDALPVIMPDLVYRCAVCSARDVELHHWMPRSLHPKANDWPKDYLCKKCHDEWHRIVTPDLIDGGSK